MTSAEIAADLLALRASTAALLAGVADEQWSDADMRQPSLLPGWTRGHVLTHIARNADGITATLAGALRGEIVPRYPDGTAGRNADIEAGAGRHATELLTDLQDSADRLDRVLAAVADADAWGATTEQDRPARAWLKARWREVEIHRVDLAGTYTAADWPPAFVGYLLPELARVAGTRTDQALRIVVDGGETYEIGAGPAVEVAGPGWAVLAWLVGRPEAAQGQLTAVPELAPWA